MVRRQVVYNSALATVSSHISGTVTVLLLQSLFQITGAIERFLLWLLVLFSSSAEELHCICPHGRHRPLSYSDNRPDFSSFAR